MTNLIPSPQFTPAGLVCPSEADIKAGVWAMMKAAFGSALNTSDASPQGQLVASLTAALGAANDLTLQYVNLVDPARSSGRMQDAIGRLYYLERIPARPTIVTATCSGAAGTVIPIGSLAKAADGTLYQSLAAATIPDGGSVLVQFASLDLGPLQLPAGSLNRIYRTVTGWDTITNASDGVPGRAVETPSEFEARRAASVAINAAGILPAVRGAVLNVSGVADAYVTENTTGTSATIGGVSVAAHSLYVCVYGGSDADVAAAIWSKKPPGCAYTGSTTVTVQDKSPGYAPPYPSYSVKFQRASSLPIYFSVVLADNGLVPSDAESQVRNAVIAAFNGADGGAKARIGGKVYALRFAAAVGALGSWAQLVSLKIGTTDPATDDEVSANIDQIPTVTAGDIAVTLA